MADQIGVRVKVKAQHAALAELVDAAGSIAAAAGAVGVCAATLGDWLNFRSSFTPATGGRGGGGFTAERARQIMRNLEELTGQSIRELFPLTKEQREVLAGERVYEQEVPVAALLNYARDNEQRHIEIFRDPADKMAQQEAAEDIDKALARLPYREREIIKLRYGLGEHAPYTHTLEECGHIFKVSRERVRSLESRALRKMGGGRVAQLLYQHARAAGVVVR